jgi:hypothetical protein
VAQCNQHSLTICLLARCFSGLSNQLAWVFKVMKVAASISGSFQIHISFFQENVLPLTRHYDALSVRHPTKAASYKSQVLDLWALFPIFCRHPVDLVSSFPKLVPVLVRAMNDERYPQLLVSQIIQISAMAKTQRSAHRYRGSNLPGHHMRWIERSNQRYL